MTRSELIIAAALVAMLLGVAYLVSWALGELGALQLAIAR